MSDQQPTRQLGNFVATTGQKPWPPVGTFVAAHGQFSMAVVNLEQARSSRTLSGRRPVLIRRQLNAAVKGEQYEQAAKLRDELKRAEAAVGEPDADR